MKAKRCTTALVNVVGDFRLKLDDNYIAFLVLLDYTKAFDSVDHKLLLRKLQTLFHFSNSACGLIRPYLINRSQRAYLNGKISNSLNVGRGIPQGSISGPLLFCTYINDLLDVLHNCRVYMYADDVQLYRSTCVESVKHCIDSINCDLQKVMCRLFVVLKN